MITTASDYKKALEESERDVFGNYTWRQAAANIDYQTQLAKAQAQQLYGEDVATAYQAATQQRANIAGTALGQGTKSALLASNEAALNQAYDQYLANYQSNLSTIGEQATSAYTELNKTLEERAANMSAFQEEHYKYLEYLDKWRQENDLTEQELNDFFDLTGWGKYYKETPVLDAEGNVLSTERTLKTWEELTMPVKDEQTGEYVSLYDNEGNLTRAGKDFFTKVENYYGQKAFGEGEATIPSFANYLYSNNQDLYNWANEYNQYSYTPTSTGISQNLGAFRQMLGIESNADTYRFLDYYGGLSRQEVDSVFNDIYSKLDTDNITADKAVESFQEIRNLVEKLGYTADNIDWEQAEKQVKDYVEQYTSAKDKSTSNMVGGTIGVAAGIASIIVGLAAAIPSFGASLAVTGVGLTAAAAGISSAAAGIEAEEFANKTESELKDYYLNIVTALTAEIQRGYQDTMLKEGGILASGGANLTVGNTYQSLNDWAKVSDTPMSDYEYNAYNKQVSSQSSDRTDYFVQGLGSGRDLDDIDITIGSTSRNTETEFDLQCGDEVKNERMIAYLNKYSTGNKSDKPSNGKLVVVAGKMYIYTKLGWRNVVSDHSNVDDAVKAFLQSK